MQVDCGLSNSAIVYDSASRKRLRKTSNPTRLGSFIVNENKNASMF
jgi:hypothetical protein